MFLRYLPYPFLKQLLLGFVLLASSFSLTAQVVDIESQRFTKEGKGFFGSVRLDGNYTQNTQQIWQVSNNTKLLYQWKRHRILVFSDFGLVQSANNDLINRGFGHLRYNFHLTKSKAITMETFQQVQYNRVQKIDVRALSGSGFRFRIFQKDSIELFTGAAAMYEYEEVQEQPIPNRDLRLSSYVSLDYQISKSLSWNNIVYFQPLATNWSDFRLTNQSTFKVALNEYLTLNLLFSLLEDTNPPVGIPSTIISIQNGLAFTF